MNDLEQKIADLKTKIDSLRPLNSGELAELQKWYRVTYTYHSNAIEGNTLTLAETKMVVEEGLTVHGKPLREIHEAVNHSRAIDLIYETIQKNGRFDEALLKNIHHWILKNIDEENAGVYRRIQVFITGEPELLCPAAQVPEKMTELFDWLKGLNHPLTLKNMAEWHYRFVKIHPFVDGNGRVARLGVNILLLQQGYPLQIIPVVRRQEYIQSLHSSKTFEDFYAFFLSVQYEAMKDYVRMVGNEA